MSCRQGCNTENGAQILKRPKFEEWLRTWIKKISSYSFSLSMGKHFTKKKKKTANIFIAVLYLYIYP